MVTLDEEKLDELLSRMDDLEERQIDFEYRVATLGRFPRFAKLRPLLWTLRQYPARPLRMPDSYRAAAPDDPPRIAVVTPSYNQGKYLAATVNSVIEQHYPNLDYVVQDGASRDSSRDVLQGFGDRVRWRSEPDSGQTSAINRGFASVSGEIMGYLNSDDLLLPGTLAYVAQAFRDNPEVDLVYGHRIVIDSKGQEIGRMVLPPHDKRTIQLFDYVPQETLFWRRRVWEAIGPFDESFRFAMDWDFILRAQEAGFAFRRLPRFLGAFRSHGRQKTHALKDLGDDEQQLLRMRYLKQAPTNREVIRASRGYLIRHVFCHRMYKLGVLKY